ncbi:MAG TPA: type II secretion system protein GspK [Nevskiaceae bacterium]|nr:type II secretion system protein GspK [Nevskiaceae bacterium]
MRPAPPSPGYVLLSCLLGLVLLTLIASRIDLRAGEGRASLQRWVDWTEAEGELADAREQLLFHLVTQPLTPLGFGEGPARLRIDGRAYAYGRVRLSLQDERGLISLVQPDLPVLRRWLLQQGIADEQIEPLIDQLADYQDRDSLHRLQGAEAEAYAEAGLPPPRNDWPLAADELRNIPAWRAQPRLVEDPDRWFSVVRDGWLNPNTAPAAILLAMPGASPEGVRRLLDWREQQPLASAAQVLQLSGIVVDNDPPGFYPGLFYRLRLWHQEVPLAMEYHLMLTPGSPDTPWKILRLRRIPRSFLDASDAPVPDLPVVLAASAPA